MKAMVLNGPNLPFEKVERPDPAIGALREIESAGFAQTHMLELMLRGKITRYFNGTV